MPSIPTKFFGDVDFAPDTVFTFPSGLPGFEDEREFLFLNVPESDPVMFLQSVSMRNLCFVLLPILAVAPEFRLKLTPEESEALRLAADREPTLGTDVLCVALISAKRGEPLCANMMAPIVVNVNNRLGIQVIHPDSGYSHRHPIAIGEPALAC
jgi:flagellar assembly factor FliW